MSGGNECSESIVAGVPQHRLSVMMVVGGRLRWPARTLLMVLMTTLVTTGCTKVQTSTSPQSPASPSASTATVPAISSYETALNDVSAMLDQRAKAIESGDRKTFLALTDLSMPEFAAEQRLLFRNLSMLPVSSFTYRLPTNAYDQPQFTSASSRLSEVVIEDVKLRGPDAEPVSNTTGMGFRKRDGQWVVAAETKKRARAGDIQSRPWGAGPITVERRGKLVIVVDRSIADRAAPLADSVADELPSVAKLLGVKPRFDLLVDATSTGRRTKIGGKKTIATAVAFTVYTLDTAGERASRIAGQRVKFDPKRASEFIGDEGLLRHELTHFLTKGSASAPQWVEEGLATYVSYYPTRPAGLLLPAAVFDRVAVKRKVLPTSAKFGADAEADYLISQSAVTYLIDTYGMKRFTKFRLAYQASRQQPDVQSRRLLNKIYDLSMAELRVRTWSKFDEFHRG